jgi:ketosteroid isomerase-like protein
VSAEAAVVDAARRRAAALARGDAQALTTLLHERFRWQTHIGEALDRDAYVSRNTGGGTTWKSQDLLDIEVVVAGDTAVLNAQVVDVVHVGEEPETFRMPMTQVWVRRGGEWLCLAGHAGPRLP